VKKGRIVRITSNTETKSKRFIQTYGAKQNNPTKGQYQAVRYTFITEQAYYRMKYVASSTCEPSY
jgi:hypothetical protein